MRFQTHLRKLTKEQRETIRECLRTFARESDVNNQMWSNLLAEERFAAQDCEQLCAALLRNHSVEQTRRLIQELSREEKRRLQGERAKTPPGTFYFRVLSLKRFARFLSKNRIMNLRSTRQASAFIRRLIGAELGKVVAALESNPLWEYLMWSSFVLSEERPSDEKPPYDAPDLPADDLLCCLGLEPEDEPLLVFQYQLPETLPPRVPTFWDAYASKSWSRYFRVRPKGEPYGMTMPTKGCRQPARPEIVHEVVESKDLVRPLNYARSKSLEKDK